MVFACDVSCSECKLYTCRCADCMALVGVYNSLSDVVQWWCDEYSDWCENVEECLEYLPTESEA